MRPSRRGDGPARVVLVGLMGVGKTTVGTLLAERLGWTLWDGDRQLEALTGVTGAVVAARDGVDELHHLEADLLLDVLAGEAGTDDPGAPAVVCAAASVVDSRRCRRALRRSTLVVWLQAPADVLIGRRVGGHHRRHADVDGAATDPALRQRRFAGVADLSLDATSPAEELAGRVVDELQRKAPQLLSR